MAAMGFMLSLCAVVALLRTSEPHAPPPVVTFTPAPVVTAAPVVVDVVQVAGIQPWRPVRRSGLPLTVLDKRWFVLGYDEARKNPAWVTYDLAGPITHAGAEPTRPATFATDFATVAHVSQRDYTGSHFDRGHMCPAYAMWSRSGSEAFLATFVCSNIVPQPHSINAGIWEELEVRIAGRNSPRVSGWAEQFDAVTVINGPLYAATTEQLRTGIAIPAACFSVIIRHQAQGLTMLALEIPNSGDPRGPLERYLVSVQQVETDSGLNLCAGQSESVRAVSLQPAAAQLWN